MSISNIQSRSNSQRLDEVSNIPSQNTVNESSSPEQTQGSQTPPAETPRTQRSGELESPDVSKTPSDFSVLDVQDSRQLLAIIEQLLYLIGEINKKTEQIAKENIAQLAKMISDLAKTILANEIDIADKKLDAKIIEAATAIAGATLSMGFAIASVGVAGTSAQKDLSGNVINQSALQAAPVAGQAMQSIGSSTQTMVTSGGSVVSGTEQKEADIQSAEDEYLRGELENIKNQLETARNRLGKAIEDKQKAHDTLMQINGNERDGGLRLAQAA